MGRNEGCCVGSIYSFLWGGYIFYFFLRIEIVDVRRLNVCRRGWWFFLKVEWFSDEVLVGVLGF